MKYKLGETTWYREYDCLGYESKEIDSILSKTELLKMGATPIGEGGHGVCCNKTVAECNCGLDDKPEKIEPIDITAEAIIRENKTRECGFNPISAEFDVIEDKLNEVIKAVNSLKGE